MPKFLCLLQLLHDAHEQRLLRANFRWESALAVPASKEQGEKGITPISSQTGGSGGSGRVGNLRVPRVVTQRSSKGVLESEGTEC